MKERFRSLATHLRQRHGRRVQKIPLDLQAECPNRDGTVGRGGCLFCSPRAAGTGLGHLPLPEQWGKWRERNIHKYGPQTAFLAYFQDHTATYLPFPRLSSFLREIKDLPGCIGLCLSTRPDTLDKDRIDLAVSLGMSELWLEMGLQSSRDETLARINRGHTAACFADACTRAAEAGLSVCAHIILGLPGEGMNDWLATVGFLNALPVAGIKFHNLFVSRGSGLEAQWRKDAFTPPSREVYVEGLARCLARLRPDIVVHRLHADPAPGELAAPAWAADRAGLRRLIELALESHGVRQGADYAGPIPHRAEAK